MLDFAYGVCVWGSQVLACAAPGAQPEGESASEGEGRAGAFRDPPKARFFWKYSPFGGSAIAYHSNNAYFRANGPGRFNTIDPDKIMVIPHIVDVSFNPEGKVYRQLTPEGVLK